ncbi:diacylglycerol kinase [Pseudidiomarina salinarum]|uniref:Diacylglycerol kinase n=1 Tax=Pseudidiomarina salinarum TaxID=435908 RepID=A0A094JDX7_9GAMM|nr:diacylglycerol kinase [Pseudidiomarina salinarum]KFZ30756.1 diacylglycerol kinase [Pseudidiomarina salinarum]RUO69279.1 diacylglycerol kinase [Pseudidiomarina salinarum]
MKPKQQGLMRIVGAAVNSARGMRAAWQSEAAVRQDVLLLVVLLPLAILAPVSPVERALMIFSLLLLLIVELINSAIEAAIDRIGAELHELSGKAKDIASAAVTFALINIAVTWLIILWPWFDKLLTS